MEFKVATILLAMMALLPIPVIITLPFELYINSTALAKSSVSNSDKFAMALLSESIVLLAMLKMDVVVFKTNYLMSFLDLKKLLSLSLCKCI